MDGTRHPSHIQGTKLPRMLIREAVIGKYRLDKGGAKALPDAALLQCFKAGKPHAVHFLQTPFIATQAKRPALGGRKTFRASPQSKTFNVLKQ